MGNLLPSLPGKYRFIDHHKINRLKKLLVYKNHDGINIVMNSINELYDQKVKVWRIPDLFKAQESQNKQAQKSWNI